MPQIAKFRKAVIAAGIVQLPVYIVAEDKDVPPLHGIMDGPQALRIIYTASRIIGRIQDNCLCARRDQGFQPVSIQLEAVRRSVIWDETSAAKADNLLIQDECRCRDNNLVTRIQNAKQRDKQCLRCTGCQDDLIRRIVHAIFFVLKAGNRFPQGICAVIVNIVGLSGGQCIGYSTANWLRRGKIRFSECQRDAAGGCACKLGILPNCTALCAVESFIQLHDGIPLACVNR